MKNLLTIVALFVTLSSARAQIQHTSTPLGDALDKAMSKSLLTTAGSQPFHLRIVISEPENPDSPYQGTIEQWWQSPDQWRREVTDKEGMHQVIVVTSGKKTEKDEGDYFPLWLRQFVTAAFEPVPDAGTWRKTGAQIEQITLPDGRKSDACVRAQGKIGEGQNSSTSYSNLCFDGEGRLKFFGSPRYSIEFHDYRRFAKRQYPATLIENPEPGTSLQGKVTILESLSNMRGPDRFTPFATDEDHFAAVPVSSMQMEKLSFGNPGMVWPAVRSGSVRGRLAMYISADRKGKVREAWPLNSDNAGLEDTARDQVRHWVLKTAVDARGNSVQVDGGLSFFFDTVVGDPLPNLSDSEVRALAINIVEPRWSLVRLEVGQVIEIQVSVDEKGKLTGTGFLKVPPAAQGILNAALSQWTFHPLIRDGKPQYFHGTLRFTVPF